MVQEHAIGPKSAAKLASGVSSGSYIALVPSRNVYLGRSCGAWLCEKAMGGDT